MGIRTKQLLSSNDLYFVFKTNTLSLNDKTRCYPTGSKTKPAYAKASAGDGGD
jgi:hypothetical protein